MEFAALSCTVQFLHRNCKLVVFIEKLQIRQSTLDITNLRNIPISLHVTLLPAGRRRKTKGKLMRDLYFVYNKELDMGEVKATEVGDMGLRMRAYVKSMPHCGGEHRLGDGLLPLRGLSLTSKSSMHTLLLTEEKNDYSTILYVRQMGDDEDLLAIQGKRHRRNHATMRGVSAARNAILQDPEIAIHLNYELDRRTMVVHIEWAKNMHKYLQKTLKFEVLVLSLARVVLYRGLSEDFEPEEFNILHQAFEIPMQPKLCREVTVVIQVLAPIHKTMRESHNFPTKSQYYPLGHARFGRRSSGDPERQLFLEMFEDEFPTERKWFHLHSGGLFVFS